MPQLTAHDLVVGYDDRTVIDALDLTIPEGEFTSIIGPNACGKSTLLHALARLLRPRTGTVVLDGTDIATLRTKETARRIGVLPQTPLSPEGITVADLVARGRYPHQSLLRSWSPQDEAAVDAALAATRVTDLRDRPVDALSGGQRQRVWIALALAQETPLLLLDEPTTFLDIGHQIEVLDLLARLRSEGRTVVAVLHEITLAARYATHLVAMRDGAVLAQGAPRDVVTPELLRTLFDVRARVLPDPEGGAPLIVPDAVIAPGEAG
ncbi:ABC transporter ATP-binding protein [Brachybacterium sp. AOP25-B2-12]|uniref:ABC transporter ATP-binding protein n=1 Tax=Brachybacterium sp. AOP25-B2-12 TaxID=3457710 RepID=UPI0040341503